MNPRYDVVIIILHRKYINENICLPEDSRLESFNSTYKYYEFWPPETYARYIHYIYVPDKHSSHETW